MRKEVLALLQDFCVFLSEDFAPCASVTRDSSVPDFSLEIPGQQRLMSTVEKLI